MIHIKAQGSCLRSLESLLGNGIGMPHSPEQRPCKRARPALTPSQKAPLDACIDATESDGDFELLELQSVDKITYVARLKSVK